MVKRDSGIMSVACDTLIYVNGEKVGAIGSGERLTAYVEPGEIILGAEQSGFCAGGLKEIETKVQKNTEYNYRISFDHNGSISISRTATK